MKKVIFTLACAILLVSCGGKKGSEAKADQDSTKTYEYFGDKITEEQAIPGGQLMSFMNDKDSANVKFSATIGSMPEKRMLDGCRPG